MSKLLDEVFGFFSASPTEPFFELLHFVDIRAIEPHPIREAIEQQLQKFSKEEVDLNLINKEEYVGICTKSSSQEDLERCSRVLLLIDMLNHAIPAKRLELLASLQQTSDDLPYNHTALNGLEVTSEGLVALKDFQVSSSKCTRNGWSFTPIPPTEFLNSAYWLMAAIQSFHLVNHTYVHLDPLIYKPENEFLAMEYRMRCYGEKLDWDRIRSLKKDDPGKWISDDAPHEQYTDYAWVPRNGEVHFFCEEVPARNRISTRGSRYFHAIYVPATDRFIHMDGAVRILSEDDWLARSNVHVRKVGKVGKRVKVFRIDHEVERQAFCNICPSFFVGNNDVAEYFGMFDG